jgi:hypothetical protein
MKDVECFTKFLTQRRDNLEIIFTQTVRPKVFAEKLGFPDSVEEVLSGITEGFQSTLNAMQGFLLR